MNEEKLCPNCNETIEDGAVYCGNCGVKLKQGSLASQVYSNGPGVNTNVPLTQTAGPNIPAYAIPHSHHKQHWAAMALAFGVLGVGAGVLVPLLGISFGIVGIVLSTSSFRVTHGWLKTAGLIASALALLLSMAFYVNAIVHSPTLQTPNQAGTSSGVASMSVTTPCYSLSFNSEFNVNNSSGSCTMNAYNGVSFADSSDVFKVVASQTSNVNTTNFDSVTKQSIEADIAKNSPSFAITSEQSSLLDGSPAYLVQAYNQSTNVALSEEAILHNTSKAKDNFFVIVHADSGRSASLNNLEKTWQWND